ncbi:DUF4238 domain-containing protein [Mesorhizobium sp. CA7]|uniref:DUF4238 domain-containing protein n=1 Tax=Mesorhizobium sp. CA7 TaxID=588501 RepID=UPI001CCB7178|nr:DUF4238 domain-containing protein [Mesorhizobium sp. CA7]MBZ9817348.1 DUF4238 domain-containing protein [Mesorhizobium sp. CA7]
MNDPQKHHFLPVFYLSQWMREDFVVEFKKVYGDKISIKSPHPNATGFVKRLYEMRGMPEETAQEFEREFLAPVDNRAAESLYEMLEAKSGNALRPGRRKAWTHFILSLLFRMPEDVELLKRNVRDDWIMSVPDMEQRYAESKRPEDPDTLLEFLNSQDGSVYEESAMGIARRMIVHENVSNTIMNMQWSVVEFDAVPLELLTSDRPVIFTESMRQRHSHILLPVGPRRLFVAVQNRKHSRWLRSRSQKELVEFVNQRVVGNAHRLVYASDEKQARFILNRLGKDRIPSFLERLQEHRETRRKRLAPDLQKHILK